MTLQTKLLGRTVKNSCQVLVLGQQLHRTATHHQTPLMLPKITHTSKPQQCVPIYCQFPLTPKPSNTPITTPYFPARTAPTPYSTEPSGNHSSISPASDAHVLNLHIAAHDTHVCSHPQNLGTAMHLLRPWHHHTYRTLSRRTTR